MPIEKSGIENLTSSEKFEEKQLQIFSQVI
jgi:hypothetical protein